MNDITIKDEVSVDIKASLVLDKFKLALSSLERVVSSRSTLPILNNVFIKADKSGVEIVGTDLEIGIRYFIGGKVETEGSVTVPGKTLISLVNSLHGETLTLTSKGSNVEIECGSTKASLNGMPADDYPLIPEVETGKVVKISGSKFKEMLDQVDFSVSRDEARPILTGVLVISDENGLTMAATDSYRLSEIVDPGTLSEQFRTVIPLKALSEIKRLIGNQEIELRVEESQVMFVVDGIVVVSRLIEGEYPNYRQIVPDSAQTVAEVDIAELSDAIKSASVFSVDTSNSVKLTIDPEGKIQIVAESSQLGTFNSEVAATVTGPGEEISFNAKYILDGLNSFDVSRCVLEVNSKTSPGVFKPVNVSGRLYIVMPLRA